jgi:nucleotide-binding universal stress UspA family protein
MRGGEGSRNVQLAAIERARAGGEPLIFVYVVSPSSLGHFDQVLGNDVREELTFMGKTLLRIAQSRARRSGIDAEMVVLEGDVEVEIDRYVQECDAGLLLVGAPRGENAHVFPEDSVIAFAHRVEQTTGVPVEVVRGAELKGERNE